MSEFVNLADVKEFLRVAHSQQDALIQRHITTAERKLLGYLLGSTETSLTIEDFYYEYGDSEQHRSNATLAVFMMVSSLYERPDKDPLTDDARAVLRPLRDPQVG